MVHAFILAHIIASMINVVTVNGGRGASLIIPELINKNFHVTSIVNAYDDGKSTGEIRRFFEMLGPSDIRKVQSLMIPESEFAEEYKKLFDFRIDENISNSDALDEIKSFTSNKTKTLFKLGLDDNYIRGEIQKYLIAFLEKLEVFEKFLGVKFSFQDCSIMNCIYAGAFVYYKRDFDKTCVSFEKLFQLRGSVIPSNTENKFLVAIRENGDVLYSEAEIVELRSNVRIKKIFLLDAPLESGSLDKLTDSEKFLFLESRSSFVEINDRAKTVLQNADIIIYSPGTQHSSLFPTYLTKGFSLAVYKNDLALKFFVTNIGEDYETVEYKASDFINSAYSYLNFDNSSFPLNGLITYNLVNQPHIKGEKTISNYVENDIDSKDYRNVKHIFKDFESTSHPGKHDGQKLLNEIINLYKSKD